MGAEQSRRRVLVTGATGAIGPAVVQALTAAGYSVRALVRHEPVPGMLPTAAEICLGDITDFDAVAQATAGCDGVVHMAALLHITNPSPALNAQYEQVNVAGTAHVVAAAQQHRVGRVVYFSSIAVYGYGRQQVLSETSTVQPETIYGKTKLAAEQIVLAAEGDDGGALGVVLRPGAIYGARVKGNYGRLLSALARGYYPQIGDGENRRTLIYEGDMAQAARLALEHPQAGGRIYNVTDGEVHTLNEIVGAMCQALGKDAPRWRLPLRPMQQVATVLDWLSMRFLRRQPQLGPLLTKYTEDVAVSGDRIQAELGFVPRYNLSMGWEETVENLKHLKK